MMVETKKTSKYGDHDPKDFEYDFGPTESTGEIASSYISKTLDDISKLAFPDGVEAYQRQQAGGGGSEPNP